MAGKHGIHPTYIQEMLSDSRYSEEDIISVIEHLQKEGGKKFSFDNMDKSETSFDLKKRFDLIFNLFDVKNINDFYLKISLIKKQAKLEDNLNLLNINFEKNSKKIISGINLLRLGNNPVKIDGKDIYNIISKNIF